MSFTLSSFYQIGPGGGGPRLWAYGSNDSISEITSDNYFLPVVSQLELNDVVMVTSSLGSSPEVTWTYCNSISNGSVSFVDGLPIPSTSTASYMTVSSQSQRVNAGGTLNLVSPAFVHFDSTNHPSIPAETTERWDYGNTGPSGSGSWSFPASKPASERLKNSHVGSGGTSSALYEDAGTFTARHKKRLITGEEITSRETTIIVADADIVYSGVSTVALHFGGVPGITPVGAATHDVQVSGWPTIESDMRYLLKSGDDFTAAGILSLPGGIHNTQVGFYEVGAAPIVGTINDGYVAPNTPSETDWPTNITVYGLNAESIRNWTVTLSHTYIRCTIREAAEAASAVAFYSDPNNSSPEVAAAYRPNYLTAFADCYIVDNSASQRATFFSRGWHTCLLGCRIGTPTLNAQNEHTYRNFESNYGVSQNCQFDVPADTFGRCGQRIHSSGTEAPLEDSFVLESYSSLNSINNCEFIGGGSTTFGVWLAPQNSTSNSQELVRDSVINGCVFTGYTGSNTEIAVGGINLGYSNCTFNRVPTVNSGFNMVPPLSDTSDGPYFNGLTLTYPTPF